MDGGFTRPGTKSSPKERLRPRKALSAAREGKGQQRCNNDPTITVQVENQVAADSKL